MKVWTLKVFNDISNNYQGIDDIEVYVFNNRYRAINALVNRSLNAIETMKQNTNCELKDLNIEEGKHFFHINNDRDYIICKIEEKEVL